MPYSRKPNESGKSDTTEIPILRKRRFAKCNNGKLDTHLFFDHILISVCSTTPFFLKDEASSP